MSRRSAKPSDANARAHTVVAEATSEAPREKDDEP